MHRTMQKNMPIKIMRGYPRIQGNLQWAVVHVRTYTMIHVRVGEISNHMGQQ